MQSPMAFDVEYREHVRQMAWVNANDRQFEKQARNYPVRQVVANALLALASAMTPAARQEEWTA
jgi:hypothetical protein